MALHRLSFVLAVGFVLFITFGARGHDWYEGYTNPQTGIGCCSGKDCQEVEGVREEGKFALVPLPEGGVYKFPLADALPSQDSSYHACFPSPDYVRCLFIPGSV